MVEQEAVNFEVAGSSPAPGAIFIKYKSMIRLFYLSDISKVILPAFRIARLVV